MSQYRQTGELYHYGIKGMKWGVRRFENKDGSLTPAGKKRYADDSVDKQKPKKELKIPDKKSKHRTNLEEKYKQKGMSQQEAEQAAARRIRGEKYAAAAAAVTVASCVAYCKYKNFSTDRELSADTDFQRIVNLLEGDRVQDRDRKYGNDRMYVAYDKKDKIKYKGLLAEGFHKENQAYKKIYADEIARTGERTKDVYNVGIKAKDKIKVASRKRAQDTFTDLYKKDADFKKNVNEAIERFKEAPHVTSNHNLNRVAKKVAAGKQLNDIDLKTGGYELFNIAIVDSSPSTKAATTKFFDSLKKQGMHAIKDINDSKYSGYGSKDPLIIFDGAFDYTQRKMEDAELASYAKKAHNMVFKETLLETGKSAALGYGSMNLVSKGIDKEAVNKYRKQHPNTKLSDKEILEMLKKEQK